LPTDRQPLDFGPPTVPSSGVTFVQRPGAKALQSAYPSRARRQGVAASVDVACQVQTDGSLVCQPAQAAGREALGALAVEFERAAETLAADYRSAPTLVDGRPSAGVVIGLRVRFALED
jgi:outer membrane biosynthesis protein TonB